MNLSNPLVSIIIPTYNRSHLIGETIDSVRKQSYRNWECLVIDDGSSDYTAELINIYLEKDPRIKFLMRPKTLPKGANTCRNFGFEKSEGKLIKWLDSDDLLQPDYLEKKIAVFANPVVDLVICNYILFNEEKRYQPFFNESIEDLLTDYVTGKININIANCLWKKESISSFKFDKELKRAQELDFHFRILKEKKMVVNVIKDNLALVRNHKDSISELFHVGDIEAIRSDLLVRGQILKYLKESHANMQHMQRAFNLYLIGIRQLIDSKRVKELYYQFHALNIELMGKRGLRLWEVKLILLLLLFKLTGRSYKLRKHIAMLKF